MIRGNLEEGDRCCRKILIYGVTGAGKTSLATRLSRLTGIPCHLVDDMAFGPNWVPTDDEDQVRAIEVIVTQDEWILDTAYGKWIDVPLSRVDLVIGLDYSRFFTFQRLFCRTFRRIFTGEPCCGGNRESLRLALSRKSILLWHFQSYSRKRQRMRDWYEQGSPRTLLFRSPRELDQWIVHEFPSRS